MLSVAEIDRPSPGSWWIGDLDVANHEAGHSVIATILGRTVTEVRIDRPIHDQGDLLGFSKSILDHEATMADIENALLQVLAGPYVGGTPLSLPPKGETSDDRRARSLAFVLGFTPTDWIVIGLRLEMLLERPSTCRAIKAVSSALLERGAIDGAEVKRLVENAEGG